MELLTFVVLFMSVLCVCESCNLTHSIIKDKNEKCNKLLQKMGGRMPQECLKEKNISFPKDVFIKAQNEDMLMVALETLKGVNKIFKNDQTSVTWKKNDLKLFTNIVHTQVDRLLLCVGNETVMDKPADSSIATLRSYFEKLEKRLKDKEFSLCSWEMVRTELQDGLKKLKTFLEIKKQQCSSELPKPVSRACF